MKRTRVTRLYEDDWVKIKQYCRELSAIQHDQIDMGEVVRRAFSIPSVDLILKSDAEMKRRLKK